MIPMRVMEVAVDEIIDVIPMRHRFMATGRAMLVRGFVGMAGMGDAAIRVGIRHGDGMFMNRAIRGRVMQVPVVEVIHMVPMRDAGVPAGGPVLVRVVVVSMRHDRHSVWLSVVSVIRG